MALYAFDGTWNEDEEEPQQDTSVVKFAEIYDIEGSIEYKKGVGTRFGMMGKLLGGIFGVGGRSRIEEMYDALRKNWLRGDHDIDIVGFSRGAALAVHFSNILAKQGLVLKSDPQEVVYPDIRFLGLWDIVGSFGIPKDIIINFQEINLGWDIRTVSDTVKNCFHARALDERRETFKGIRLESQCPNFEEVWFRGVHSDIGGGNGNNSRNNIALEWMLTKARESGLAIPQAEIDYVQAATDTFAPVYENFDPFEDPRRKVLAQDVFHASALEKQLDINEESVFPVRAASKYNWTGIKVRAGETYQFEIAGDQKWFDAGISCGPEGWDSEQLPWFKEKILEFLEDNRRVPGAQWFELIGTIDENEDDHFRIGRGGTAKPFKAEKDGVLFAFANDLKSKYGNNKGQLTVKIKRIA
ncbi:MAG: DUF2235 domain-containing protein [Desulfobulbaceae bacterium]|nr:DUF2235 domain-containing protein [Desulfobulbaceae bacterium]